MAKPQSGARSDSFDAGDPQDVDQRNKHLALKEAQRINGLRIALRTRDGRVWVRNMLETAHVFHTSFTGNSGTFFNEGERNQALRLLADLSTHCVPELLVLFAEQSVDPVVALRQALAILSPVTNEGLKA